MYHSTEYHREFWDAARGKPVSYNYIEKGRNTQNGSYRLPYESDQKFTAARKQENIFRQIARVVDAPRGDHTIWTQKAISPKNLPAALAEQRKQHSSAVMA